MAISNYDKRQVNVYKVLAPWDAGSINWNNAPAVNDTRIEDYQLVNDTAGKWVAWDITRVVKEWLRDGANYGLMLRNSDENASYNQFFSSDVSDYDEYGNNLAIARPVMAIQYVNNSGLENYWTYHSQDMGRAGTGYVNDFNGNLVFIHNDVSMSGSKMPITLNHVFNSNEKDIVSGYGNGWRLNLSQRVTESKIGDTQYYIYTDEDGTKHYFYYDSSDKTYKQQMGTDLTFNKGTDGSYTIKDKSGGVLEFVPGGYLHKIKDKNDNTLTLSYDGTILKKITDGAGRVTILDVLSNGYLVGIIEPDGSRTSFAYNGQQLSKITYPDGNYTVFTYDSKNNLKKVLNYDGYNINYDYYTQAPYRVSSIKEFGTDGAAGEGLSIAYGYNTTTFTDNKSRVNLYQFTDYGMTKSIKNSDESAEVYRYDDSNKNLYNKLTAASRVQKFSKNYIKNHSVELNTSNWEKASWRGVSIDEIKGSITTEEAYMGTKSLKVTKDTNSIRDFYQQWLSGLVRKKSYVLSAYVKTKDITKTSNRGAALFISYKDTSGKYNTFESTYIQGINQWSRYYIRFTLPDNADTANVSACFGIIEESGTAYFDCIQLEEGNVPSRYSLVENADFSYSLTDPSPWRQNPESDSGDKLTSTADGKTLYKIVGAVGKKKNISQEFNISGKAGDSFIVSGWAKGSSVALSDNSVPDEEARRFALRVGLEKSSTEADWFVIPFNEDIDDWQYISSVIVAKSDYRKVSIYGEYYNNLNEAYFTDFQLYKEEYGASYTYDEKGNVISVQSLAKEKSSFNYDGNNNLKSVVTPTNGVYEYKYDSKRNLTNAVSATKVQYSFDYDSSGNPVKSRVEKAPETGVTNEKLFMESTANYSISGNYLKAAINNEENSVISHYNEEKGVLTATTDGKGSKTFYSYDDMNRLVSVSKALEGTESRNIEKFPLSSSLVGSKGTRTIFDAGANLLVNSSFENSSNSWRLEDWDGSTGKWRIVPGGIHGNYCLESYDSDGTATGNPTNAVAFQLVTLSTALTSSKVYTLSAYAKRTGLANPVLGIQCFDKNGAEIAGSYKNYQKDIAKDRWVKVSESFILPIGTKSIFVILRSAVSGTDTVSFDAVQMEEGNSFTAYSPSRSDNSRPYYDLGIDKKSGTLSVWFNTTGTGTRMIFSNESKTALFNLYINEQNKIILSSLNKSNAGQNIITANDITITNNTWYFIALKWQLVESSFYSRTLQCTLYINSRTYTGSVTDFKDFTGAITAVGSNPYGNYSLSGTLDDFAYSRKALIDNDIKALYSKTMPEDRGTIVTNSYTYEKDKIKTISHNGFSYRFEYDSLGNTKEVYAENELLIRNEFDAETGNLTKSEYGNNQRVSMEYDELDRVTKRKFNRDISDNSQKDEIRYTYEYDNEGNLAYHEDGVNFRDYKYSYDLSDRLVKINEYDEDIGTSSYGKTYSTKFDYDMSNNHSIITEKIDENLYETRYGYDKDNKPVGVFYDAVIEDSPNFEYFHLSTNTTGSRGKTPIQETPIFEKDENDQGALYAYPGTKVICDLGIDKKSGTMTAWVNTRNNTGSRMIIGTEGPTELFNLYIDKDQKVNLAVIGSKGFTNIITTDETLKYNTWYFVAVSWQFDPGNLTLTGKLYLNHSIYKWKTTDFKDFSKLKTAIGSNIGGTYSLNGLIRNFNYSSSDLTEGEILSLYTNKSVRYSYDNLGRLQRKTINIGRTSFQTQYAYVSVTGKEEGATVNRLSSVQNELAPINYWYDENGNITRILENGKNIRYFYNELNELIKEENEVLNKTVIYTYDSGGNISSKQEIINGVSQTPISYLYETPWKDKLTRYNKNEITYDKIGNPKTYAGYTYSWEEGRRLASIVGSDINAFFKYNDAGIRTYKRVNGFTTKFHLIGDRVTYEYTEDANHVIKDKIYYRYDNADDLVSMNLNGVDKQRAQISDLMRVA